jgi:hypothetical protein
MLGTYPPKNEFQAVDIPRQGWHEAPSGALARGEYKAKVLWHSSRFRHLAHVAIRSSSLTMTRRSIWSSNTSSGSPRTGRSKSLNPKNEGYEFLLFRRSTCNKPCTLDWVSCSPNLFPNSWANEETRFEKIALRDSARHVSSRFCLIRQSVENHADGYYYKFTSL